MNAIARTFTQSQAPTLVYGLGQTGLSVARYLKRNGIDALFLDSRQQPPGMDELKAVLPDAEIMLGQVEVSQFDNVARVIVSPGIPDHDKLLGELRQSGITTSSDIDVFVEEHQAPFVAITGTNGKSTVTTLVARMCASAALRVLAGGNLGFAVLDLLAEEVPELYVLELSSFHLQRTHLLPAKVAVLLNVSPDHLDWHRDEAEYRDAKHRIYAEAASAVFNRSNTAAHAVLRDDQPSISFGLDQAPDGHYGLAQEGGVEYLARGSECLMPIADVALVGRHNLANALAALATGDLLGLPMAPMLETLRTFGGLPHRMQFVRELNGVRYINDSKATNVGASIASVLSVDGPVVLLAGGQGKGGDFDSLAQAVASKLKAIIVFGEDAENLEDAFADRAQVLRVSDMQAALLEARGIAVPGDTVLLAPACASFDQFVSYLARGDAFVHAVEALSA